MRTCTLEVRGTWIDPVTPVRQGSAAAAGLTLLMLRGCGCSGDNSRSAHDFGIWSVKWSPEGEIPRVVRASTSFSCAAFYHESCRCRISVSVSAVVIQARSSSPGHLITISSSTTLPTRRCFEPLTMPSRDDSSLILFLDLWRCFSSSAFFVRQSSCFHVMIISGFVCCLNFCLMMQVVAEISAHEDDVNAVAYLDSSPNLILTGSDDDLIKVTAAAGRWTQRLFPVSCPFTAADCFCFCLIAAVGPTLRDGQPEQAFWRVCGPH